MSPTSIDELKAHRLRTPGELAFTFHWRRWRDGVYCPALRRAKIRRIRIHDVRHTCASILIATCADVVAVSRHLGHTNPSITLTRYSHFFERLAGFGLGTRMAAFIKEETAAVGFRLVGDAASEVNNVTV